MEQKSRIIKVAILAEEPLFWASGKHFFPVILDGYSWTKNNITYTINTKNIYDKDILKGDLFNLSFDVLLIPGGGVGDGEVITKGFNKFGKVKKWKKNIQEFVKNGGGCIGICGGAALVTDLVTKTNRIETFMERQYNKSSIGISCISSYYKELAFTLFYPFQRRFPEKIGASFYVFSFAPGKTKDGKNIHTGGVPVDFIISHNNPIFKDYTNDNLRLRWWGGPGFIIPKNPDRDVKILLHYPKKDISENEDTKIFAWVYKGNFFGLLRGIIRSARLIRKEKDSFRNLLIYAYFLAGKWKKTDTTIELGLSDKPCMTIEIYPNKNKGRIILIGAHPEYMIWWGGNIEEHSQIDFNDLAHGLHIWKNIDPLSKELTDELTHTWWVVRRMVAWAGKIPDDHLPPIEKGEINEKVMESIKKNIYWDGTIVNIIKNI
jgi:glutamine amidotransferase-like uncharacterized protein